MSNINILGLKGIDNKLFFLISLALLLLVYSPLLSSVPFGDDYVYIFSNPHMRDAAHPFVFFQYGSEYFKSWPLSFSFLWVFKKLFADNYCYYRLVNIFVHFVNALIVFKISKFYFKKYNRVVFSLFLFNPLVVENIYWIFQFKTILSTFFFLLCLWHILIFNTTQLKATYYKGVSFFLLSLLSKSCAVFFPIALVYILKYFKSKWLLLVPFFVLSVITGIENFKGVVSQPSDLININTYHQRYIGKNKDVDLKIQSPVQKSKFVQAKTYKKEQLVLKQYISGISSYTKSILNLDSFFIKTIVAANSYSHYIKSTLAIGLNNIIYPNLDLTKTKSYILPSLVILILLFLVWIKKVNLTLLTLSFLLFLPISGYFYVPYMDYSYIADHWFYTSLPFTIMAFVICFKNKASTFSLPLILYLFPLLCILQTTRYTNRLSDTKSYFYDSLKIPSVNKQIIYEYLVEIEQRDKNYNQALDNAKKAYSHASNKKELLAKSIIYLSSLVGDKKSEYEYLIQLSKTYYEKNNILLALNVLEGAPKELREINYYALMSIYKLILQSDASDDLKKIESLILQKKL